MIRTATALIALSLLLAGCGANGAPEPPEGYQPHPDKDFVLDPLVKAPEKGRPATGGGR
jgi:predicted small lipoprotein YifL